MIETLEKVVIEKADIEDIAGIVRLIREFFEESLSVYSLSLDASTIHETVTKYVTDYIGLVARRGDKIIGTIGGFVMPSIFDKNQLVGQETIWYVTKEERKGSIGIRLIKEFENRCKEQGAHLIVMVHMENLYADVLDKLYKIRGYKLMENQYIKEI